MRRLTFALIMAILSIGQWTPAAGQASLDEKLSAYEKKIDALQGMIDSLRKEIAELKATRATPIAKHGEPATQQPEVQPPTSRLALFGYIQSQAEDTAARGTSR